MQAGRIGLGRVTATAVVTALALLCLLASAANAAAPSQLAKVPEDGKPGAAAGRLDFPLGIAADPNLPGHVYVADASNARIDEFTPWGEFVKAWGWEVNKALPEAKLQTCTKTTGCQKGKEGAGDGEFSSPEAVAVDGTGAVYVIEAENHRIQKFAPGPEAGEATFLAKFGEAKLGLGKFAYRGGIAACPTTNAIYVGEGKKIEVFEASGAFKEEIKFSGGEEVEALASDGACNLYAAFQGKAEVRKLKGHGPTAEFLEPGLFKPESGAENPKSVALDGHGNLYVNLRASGGEPIRVQKYTPTGTCLTCGGEGEGGKPGFDRSNVQLEGVAASSACEADDAYTLHFAPGTLSYFNIYGEPPNTTKCPQPKVAPEITAQYALAAETGKAELQAEINPRFWNSTTSYVEYGTAECKMGGCTKTTAPVVLTTKTIGSAIPTAPVFLEGLAPGTTYHYRFVAKSEGGGPVFGIDPDGREGPREANEAEGFEGAFTTFRTPASPSCPENEAFRTGPSELLPDCRAYEMVSPLDKEGGDIVVLPELTTNLPSVLNQSATSGERVAFGSYRSFGGAAAAPYTTQYVAARKAGVGWETHAISPPRGRNLTPVAPALDTELRALSPDLCQAWLGTYAEAELAPEAPPGYIDLYRRTDEECGGPTYSALNTIKPPHLAEGPPVGSAEVFIPELQGLSADGSTSVFIANDALEEGRTPCEKKEVEPGKFQVICKFQLYAVGPGGERFLCILPGGTATAIAGPCTAGGSTESPGAGRNRSTNLAGAISADGSKVFWTATSGGPGPIYLRENPLGEGPECAEATSPCTIAVSKAAEEAAGSTGKGSQFWMAAKDGSRALFTTEPSPGQARLYEFVLGEPNTPHLIAKEVLGTLGASEDASRVYFASREGEELTSEPNPEKRVAVKGQANLYLYEAGQFHFIGALSGEDLGRPSPIALLPSQHSSRVSPDGLHAAFMSSASLTEYDNTDQSSGEADAEVFLYSAPGGGAAKLVCASCNPSGARPLGRQNKGQTIWSAARIPTFENNLYASRVLSTDGRRLYFDSTDALAPRDSNGKEDVYQWEAPETGRCTESSPTYSPQDGGCVDLVSSGQSKLDSEFLDASPSGKDVFFTTLASLVPQDFGLLDVYDAREGGGLPTPPPAAIECEGETCQHPAAGPEFQTPGTAVGEGPGNLPPEKSKPPKCPKGKHKVTKNGKSSCVKNKQAKKQRRAGNSGRAQG